MDWNGKKINFLGDSITQGVGASCTETNYVNQAKELLGLSEAVNYGISGTRIAPRKAAIGGVPPCNDDFISRAELMDADADGIVVFGGTNDFGHGDAPLGTPADTTPDTFCGALHTLFVKLIERYPGKPIVILTPLHRTVEDNVWGDGHYKEYPDHPLRDYVQAIRDIAEYYSLPVLDLWAVSGIQPKVPVIKEKLMPDGLHPNDAGHRLVAERLAGFLKAL